MDTAVGGEEDDWRDDSAVAVASAGLWVCTAYEPRPAPEPNVGLRVTIPLEEVYEV